MICPAQWIRRNQENIPLQLHCLITRSWALTQLSIFVALSVCPVTAIAQYAAINPESRAITSPPPTSLYRHYDACARVSVFSIPVFTRCGVGGGFASISHDPDKALVLRFVSGSSPERAHGLNRMGLIQEVVREEGARPAESSYFGVMTFSGEESVSQGRAALGDAKRGKDAPYTVAQGLTSGSSMRYSICQVQLPASFRWSDSADMLRQIQEQLKSQTRPAPLVMSAREPGNQPAELRTFLYAMRSALMSPATKTEQTIVHNGGVFRLTIVKSTDSKVGAELASAGLIASVDNATHVAGVIKNLKTHSETMFSAWYDSSSTNILPLRFEFRPKSY